MWLHTLFYASLAINEVIVVSLTTSIRERLTTSGLCVVQEASFKIAASTDRSREVALVLKQKNNYLLTKQQQLFDKSGVKASTGSERRLAACFALRTRREAVVVSVASSVPEARTTSVVRIEEPHDGVVGAATRLLRHCALVYNEDIRSCFDSVSFVGDVM